MKLNSFRRVLIHHGFKYKDKSYQHSNGWFAQLLDRGKYKDLLLVGHPLPSGSFPGGKVYGSYDEVNEELSKHTGL